MNAESEIPPVLLGRDDELSCHRDYSLHVRDVFTKVIATLKRMPKCSPSAVSARLRVIAPGFRFGWTHANNRQVLFTSVQSRNAWTDRRRAADVGEPGREIGAVRCLGLGPDLER